MDSRLRGNDHVWAFYFIPRHSREDNAICHLEDTICRDPTCAIYHMLYIFKGMSYGTIIGGNPENRYSKAFTKTY